MTVLGIVAIYLIALLAFGLYHRQSGTSEDYFLAGRQAGPVMLAGSLIATMFGAFGVMGVAGMAHRIGLVAGWYHWVGTIGLLLMGAWALRRVSLAGVYTLPELLGRSYGPLVRRLSGLLIVAAWLSIIAAQFVAAGKIAQFLVDAQGINPFGQDETRWWILLTGAAVTVYTVVGGQRSVIRTDLLQAVLVGAGILLLFVVLLFGAGSKTHPTPDHFGAFPFSPAMTPVQWVTLLLTLGVPFLVGPDMYSRVLSGRDEQSARRGVLAAAGLMIPLVLMIVLCGMMGRAQYGLEGIDSERILLLLAFDHLPPILAGLLIAALMAAVMSSADTCLMTVGTIGTRDVLGIVQADSDARAVGTGRLLVLVAGVIGLILALVYTSIISALYTAYKLYSPGVLIPFLALALLPKWRFGRWTGPCATLAGSGVALLGIITGWPVLGLIAFLVPLVPIGADLLTRKGEG